MHSKFQQQFMRKSLPYSASIPDHFFLLQPKSYTLRKKPYVTGRVAMWAPGCSWESTKRSASAAPYLSRGWRKIPGRWARGCQVEEWGIAAGSRSRQVIERRRWRRRRARNKAAGAKATTADTRRRGRCKGSEGERRAMRRHGRGEGGEGAGGGGGGGGHLPDN